VKAVRFLAKIHKGKIRVPPTRGLKDGSVVEVTIEPVREEEEEEKEEG
jgi:hypothetical protein